MGSMQTLQTCLVRNCFTALPALVGCPGLAILLGVLERRGVEG